MNQVISGDTVFSTTIKEVYGKDEVEIQTGYEYVRFGIAGVDDYFIDPVINPVYGNLIRNPWFAEDRPATPVIIIKQVLNSTE